MVILRGAERQEIARKPEFILTTSFCPVGTALIVRDYLQ